MLYSEQRGTKTFLSQILIVFLDQISNILYSENHYNYLAATARLLLCCYITISHRRLVPIFVFSPVHHYHEELHQLLLVLQVGVSLQVLDDFYYLNCL